MSGRWTQVRSIEQPTGGRIDQLPGAGPMVHLAADHLNDVDIDDSHPTAVPDDALGPKVELLGRGETLIDVLGRGILRLHHRCPERRRGLEIVGGQRLVEAGHHPCRVAVLVECLAGKRPGRRRALGSRGGFRHGPRLIGGEAAAVGATSGDAVGSVVGVGAAGASTVIATDGAATWPAALNQLATGMAKAMATPSAAATGARNESE